MSTTVKFRLEDLGIALTKGETYRIAINENFVYESGSPILLPNAQSDNLVEWTAAGANTDNISITFGAGADTIIITTQTKFSIHDAGDYIAQGYYSSGYISGDLGTITLYGEDSTLAYNWNFPHDSNVLLGDEVGDDGRFFTKIILTGANLTDTQTYWISIPVDIIEDVFTITNDAMLDYDFVYNQNTKDTNAVATLDTESSVQVAAMVYKDFATVQSINLMTSVLNPNDEFGQSVAINDNIFMVISDNVSGLTYQHTPYISNYTNTTTLSEDDFRQGGTGTYTFDITMSDDYVLVASSESGLQEAYKNVSSVQTLSPISISTMDLIHDQSKISKQNYYISSDIDTLSYSGISRIRLGYINPIDDLPDNVQDITPTNFSNVGDYIGWRIAVNDEFFVSIDEDGHILSWQTANLSAGGFNQESSLFNEFSTAKTNVLDIAISRSKFEGQTDAYVYVLTSIGTYVYQLSTGVLIETLLGGVSIDASNNNVIIGQTGAAKLYRSGTHELQETFTWPDTGNDTTVAISDNGIIVGEPDRNGARGLVYVYSPS